MELRDLRHAAALSLAAGRHAHAEVLLRQLLLQTPHDGQLWVRHAEALRRLDRRDDAAASFRQGANVLATEGQLSRAIAALKLALQLRPDDLDLVSELIQLQRRRSVEARGRVGAVPAALEAMGPLDANSRAATLEYAMADFKPSAPRLALPARPASIDANGTVERLPVDVSHAVPPLAEAREVDGVPFVRRLSDRAVAVQAGPGAPWVVIESAAPLTVRQVD